MTLVPLLSEDQFAPEDHEALTRGATGYGQVLNTWAAIGNSPGLFNAYLPFVIQVNRDSTVGRIKELIGVRVSVLNHCRYTTSHRCASASAKGISEKDLVAVARGELSTFTDREQVALRLALSMTRDVSTVAAEESATGVTAALLERAQQAFTPAELIEITMSIGVWNALSRFHRIMSFELDMPAAPDGVLAEL